MDRLSSSSSAVHELDDEDPAASSSANQRRRPQSFASLRSGSYASTTGSRSSHPCHSHDQERQQLDHCFIQHQRAYKTLGFFLFVIVFLQPMCYISMVLVLSENDKCLNVGIFMVVNGISCVVTALLFCVMTMKIRSPRSAFVKASLVSSVMSVLTNLGTCLFSGLLLWDVYFHGNVHLMWEEHTHDANLTSVITEMKTRVKLPPPEVHVIVLIVLFILFAMTLLIVSVLTTFLSKEVYQYEPLKTSRTPSIHSIQPLWDTASNSSSDFQASLSFPASPRFCVTQRTLAPLVHPSFFHEGAGLPEELLSDEGIELPVLISYTALPD